MLRWGDIFLALANFWTFAPLHLRKQSGSPRPRRCLVFTLEVKPSHFLMHTSCSVCTVCVCTIVFDCVFCAQKIPPMHSRKHGLCGNPLKETRISFQTEAKCRSPQTFMRSCHRWQPFHSASAFKLKASLSVPETFLFSPTGGSLHHLAGDPEHLSQPRAEGNAPPRVMLGNSEL